MRVEGDEDIFRMSGCFRVVQKEEDGATYRAIALVGCPIGTILVWENEEVLEKEDR